MAFVAVVPFLMIKLLVLPVLLRLAFDGEVVRYIILLVCGMRVVDDVSCSVL